MKEVDGNHLATEYVKMKRLLMMAVLAATVSTAFAADEINLNDKKARQRTPEDCFRLVENAKHVVELRDDGEGITNVTAAMLRVPLLRDVQYRITLPLLLNFTTEAYGAGKSISGDDLVKILDTTCRSQANGEWVYF